MINKSAYLLGIALVLLTGCSSLKTINTSEDSQLPAKNEETKVVGEISGMEEEMVVEGFNSPTGLAMDDEGMVYVSNWSTGVISQIDRAGAVTVFSDELASPSGLAFGQDGLLYVAEYSANEIYTLSSTGEKKIFAKDLQTPAGLTFNATGELLVANRSSNEIVKINSLGEKEVIASNLRTPVAVAEAEDGTLFVANFGGGIIKVDTNGVNSEFSDDFTQPGVGAMALSANT